jgi:hypothetical protein
VNILQQHLLVKNFTEHSKILWKIRRFRECHLVLSRIFFLRRQRMLFILMQIWIFPFHYHFLKFLPMNMPYSLRKKQNDLKNTGNPFHFPAMFNELQSAGSKQFLTDLLRTRSAFSWLLISITQVTSWWRRRGRVAPPVHLACSLIR